MGLEGIKPIKSKQNLSLWQGVNFSIAALFPFEDASLDESQIIVVPAGGLQIVFYTGNEIIR
jgi:hypothetical protein